MGQRKGFKHTQKTKNKMALAHKGINTWTKGRKLSDETKLKMKIAKQINPVWNKGKANVYSKKVLIKMSLARKNSPVYQYGQSNPNYKGGITPLVKMIRNCSKYKEWRTACFNRDKYTCQQCNRNKCYIEVDHIKSFALTFDNFLSEYSQFSPIEDKETLVRLSESYEPFWDIKNGRTLCKKCHKNTINYCRRIK